MAPCHVAWAEIAERDDGAAKTVGESQGTSARDDRSNNCSGEKDGDEQKGIEAGVNTLRRKVGWQARVGRERRHSKGLK